MMTFKNLRKFLIKLNDDYKNVIWNTYDAKTVDYIPLKKAKERKVKSAKEIKIYNTTVINVALY